MGATVGVKHVANGFVLGLRRLKRAPLLATLSLASLAMGVGINASLLDIVDRLLYRVPAQVALPESLVAVPQVSNFPQFEDLRDRLGLMDIAVQTGAALRVGDGGDVFVAEAECVSEDYFAILGTPIIAGRSLAAAREEVRIPAVISDSLWRQRYSGTADTIGRRLELAGRSAEIVGVAPHSFNGIRPARVDLWLLIDALPTVCSPGGENLLSSAQSAWLTAIGRLRPGTDLQEAEAEIETLVRSGDAAIWRQGGAPSRIERLFEARANRLNRGDRLTIWLAGAAAALLLIGCTNVAGLFVAQLEDRRLELQLRTQLGATAGQAVLHTLGEVGALICAGTALSGVVALGAQRVLVGFYPLELAVFDGRFMLVVTMVACVAMCITAAAPVIQVLRLLRLSARRRQVTRASLMVIRILLVAQVGLAAVLAAGTSLFVRSVDALSADLGYDVDDIVSVTLDPAHPRRLGADEQDELFEGLRNIVDNLATVTSVTVSSRSVLETGRTRVVVGIKTDDGVADRAFNVVTAVDPAYFDTLGTRIVAGRPFLASDSATGPAVTIVDTGIAGRLWPSASAVGQCVVLSPRSGCSMIVGVIETRRHSTVSVEASEVLVPLSQRSRHGFSLPAGSVMVRSSQPASRMSATIAGLVPTVVEDRGLVVVRPLAELVSGQTRSWRLGASMFAICGILGALIASVGVHAALSFGVRRRSRELAIRIAVGASPRTIAYIAGREALIVLAAGCALGVGGYFALSRAMRDLLFGINTIDTASIATSVLVVLISGATASAWPVIRAVRMSPAVVLKED